MNGTYARITFIADIMLNGIRENDLRKKNSATVHMAMIIPVQSTALLPFSDFRKATFIQYPKGNPIVINRNGTPMQTLIRDHMEISPV